MAPAGASYSHISDTTAAGGKDSCTSGTMNTGAAHLVVCALADYSANAAASLLSSTGDSFTCLTRYSNVSWQPTARICYKFSPTNSTIYSVTGTGTASYCSITCSSFSGGTAADTGKDVGKSVTATPVSVGNITPSVSGALVITMISAGVGTTVPYDPNGAGSTGPTYTKSTAGMNAANGCCFSLDMAWQIQTTPTLVNNVWTFTGSTALGMSLAQAAFK